MGVISGASGSIFRLSALSDEGEKAGLVYFRVRCTCERLFFFFFFFLPRKTPTHPSIDGA